MKKRKITRDIIIQSVICLADRKGLRNVTLKDISDDLEIKTPSLYNHISGIDEIYDMLANHGLTILKEELMKSTIGLSGRDAILSMGEAYRKFSKDFSSLYESTQLVTLIKDSATIRLSDDILEILSKIISIYNFSPEENIHIIRTLRAYLHGFSTLEQTNSFGIPISLDDSFILGLDLIIGGIDIKYNKKS